MLASKFAHKLHTVEDGGFYIRAASGNIPTNQVVSDVEFEIEGQKYLNLSSFVWTGHRCYFGHEFDESEWGTH
jgi:hypothetical protein